MHPHNAKYYNDAAESRIIDCLQHPKAVAWGECGIDPQPNPTQPNPTNISKYLPPSISGRFYLAHAILESWNLPSISAGLDFHYNHSPQDVQKQGILARSLSLSQTLNSFLRADVVAPSICSTNSSCRGTSETNRCMYSTATDILVRVDSRLG